MKAKRFMTLACALAAFALTGCASPKESRTEATAVQESQATDTTANATTDKATDAATGKTTDASGEGKPLLRVGSLKGPTTMGLASLMDLASRGESRGSYEFTMVTAADELVGKMASGQLDIALVPANLASILYQKTGQGICVLNINTLGVLYVASADPSIQGLADLKGKTVYMTGKGTTPDHVFGYLLKASGLEGGDVTIEYKSEASEVAAVLKEQPEAIGLLPQPFATVALAQNEALKLSIDLTQEWDKLQIEEGGRLVTGVTVCRKEVLEDEAGAEAVRLFMEEHRASAEYAGSNPEEAAQLVVTAGIIEKAPIAQKALPYCSIVCIDGTPMQEMLSGYLSVLYQQDPSSTGGQLPDAGFYYLP